MGRVDSVETYRFGPFELDVALYELRRDGRRIRLERRPMDLLIHLIENRDRLVLRSDIADRLWGKEVFVDCETGVNTAISKVRQALRDSSDAPSFIETVPGKGYRFIAAVEVVHVAKILRAPASAMRLAVLPFDNLTGNASREYLADGLTEELITILGGIDPERLVVIGRTSMMNYKGRMKSIAEIGRELNAQHVIEGSVRAEGGRLRVTAKLIRGADQYAIWSASYDAEPASLLAFQRELSTAIAQEIRVRLTPDSLDALAHRQTRHPDAYDLYLRGRYFWNQLTPATNERAIECFEGAIALDREYALAWAGVAFVEMGSTMNSDAPPTRVLPRAREAAARAVRSSPSVAEAHSAAGAVGFVLEWNWPAAEAALHRAIALDSGCVLAHRFLGHLLSQTGRHAEARRIMQRLCELDPLYGMNHAMASLVAFQARDYALALDYARRAVAIDPEFWIAYQALAQAYAQIGEIGHALDALTHAARLSGRNSKALSLRGYLLAKSGHVEEARELLRTLGTIAQNRYMPPYALALVQAGLGTRDAIFETLDKAIAARDVHLIFLPVDPIWDEYRSDPRLDAVLARCGFTRAV